jgi:predicted nuclease with TOPRIM domain
VDDQAKLNEIKERLRQLEVEISRLGSMVEKLREEVRQRTRPPVNDD